jgi:hypothetical protein
MTPHQSNSWEHLAEQASKEMNPKKMLELVTELNRVLGEREEVSRRLRNQWNQPKSLRSCQ